MLGGFVRAISRLSFRRAAPADDDAAHPDGDSGQNAADADSTILQAGVSQVSLLPNHVVWTL